LLSLRRTPARLTLRFLWLDVTVGDAEAGGGVAMERLVWVVDRSDDGGGWAVREVVGGAPLVTTRLKEEAVEFARTGLANSGSGGELRVHFGDGRLEQVLDVQPAPSEGVDPATSRPDVSAVAKRIDDEGGHIDHGFELFGAAVSAGLISPALAATVSPEVQGAMSEGWIAVFFATLTWSLGCAVAVVLAQRSGLLGWPLVNAVILGFFIALGIATWLGTGVLDLGSATQGAGNPLEVLFGFAEVAVRTYGPVGALVGGGVGVWLGVRAAPLFNDKFLA